MPSGKDIEVFSHYGNDYGSNNIKYTPMDFRDTYESNFLKIDCVFHKI